MLVNMHEAKTQLSRLVDRAAAGEDIVIGKAGRPVARLVPYAPPNRRRTPGRWAGQVEIAADFDDTPEEVLRGFDGA